VRADRRAAVVHDDADQWIGLNVRGWIYRDNYSSDDERR